MENNNKLKIMKNLENILKKKIKKPLRTQSISVV